MSPREVAFACNLDCGAGCALIAEIEDGKISRVFENPLGGEYTRASRYRINSTNYNIKWFREREEQALLIHSKDAASRGISHGDLVMITSSNGVVQIGANLSDDIMEGVVCLLEGAWSCFNEDGVEENGSVNVLTSTVPTMPSHGSRTHSVNVQVRKA